MSPPSNSSTSIGAPLPFSIDGLVSINSNGNLFASGNGGTLYEVNTATASATPIGDTGLGNTLYGGTFVGSTLYGFSFNGTIDTIYTIDTSNANSTPGAAINFNSPNGGSYAVVAAAAPFGTAPVPEPSSLVLGLIGGLGVLACGLVRKAHV